MIKIIKWLLLTLFNILPDSPFAQVAEELELQQDVLQYMNWFLPLDIVGNMFLAWLDCILLYVLFHIIVQILKSVIKTIIQGIAKAAVLLG